MSTNSICFHREIRKLFSCYPLLAGSMHTIITHPRWLLSRFMLEEMGFEGETQETCLSVGLIFPDIFIVSKLKHN